MSLTAMSTLSITGVFSRSYVSVNGTRYTEPAEIEVQNGTVIIIMFSSYMHVDGEEVARCLTTGDTYELVVNGNTFIHGSKELDNSGSVYVLTEDGIDGLSKVKHSTLIAGTSYKIVDGKVLVDGTSFDLRKGKTLIDGTEYDIVFGRGIPVFVLESASEQLANTAYLIIDGEKYYQQETLYVEYGSIITCCATNSRGTATGAQSNGHSIILNGKEIMLSYKEGEVLSYDLIVTKPTYVKLYATMPPSYTDSHGYTGTVKIVEIPTG